MAAMGAHTPTAFACALVVALALPARGLEPADPRPAESGFPIMRAFDDAEHGGAPQNFAVAADTRGYIYIGNLHGLLVWDGARWRHVPHETALYHVAVNAHGHVLAGGPQRLALLDRNAAGGPVLRAITDTLPADAREFGDVRGIVAAGDGFDILTDTRLLHFDGSKLGVLATVPRSDAAPRLLSIAGHNVVATEGRVLGVSGDAPLLVARLAGLNGRTIEALAPGDAGRLFAAVRDVGLVIVDERGGVTPLVGEASAWAKRNHISSAIRLRDGRLVFGSLGGGLLITDRDGRMDQVIDMPRGLPDDQVAEVAEDREGGLWAALTGGLVRLDMQSQVTVFDRRAGMPGAAQAVFRHEGSLYVSGSWGLGRLESQGFSRVRGIAGSVWDAIEPADGERGFIVAAATGLFRVQGLEATLLPGTLDARAYALAREPGNRALLVGTRDGLRRLVREGRSYRFTPSVPGSPRYIRSILVRPNRVFLATVFDGVVAMTEVDPAKPPTFQKLGGGEGEVFMGPEGPLAIASDEANELFAIDESVPKLVKDAERSASIQDGLVWRAVTDARGNLWTNAIPPRVFPFAQGVLSRTPLVLHGIPPRRIEMIEAESNGVVWIGGTEGLYRHAGPPAEGPHTPPSPVIARVSLDGAALFDGWANPGPPPSAFPHGLRRLQVEFSPLSHERALAYQFRLDPIDRDWSAWSSRAEVEYTTLQEGAYTFRVRTRGAEGDVGPDTAWSFSVAPPWHRTLAARAAFLLSAGLLIGAFIGVRTRVLRREARRLAERVEERTRDLKRAVRDLETAQARVEEQNRQLAEANARLDEVSRHDSLTGIANRRHFDQVFEEEWARARRERSSLVVGLLDLDHFKALNDTLGHGEGDRALRSVAATLEATMRRAGDTVARYGGEEFAFILAGTTLAGALNVAEDVRARIEALRLPNPGSPLGHLTASLGLVEATPDDDFAPQRLLDIADRALYAAKSEGRNRVHGVTVAR